MSWYTPVAAEPDLSGELATAWTAWAGGAERLLVPDGCVDVLWLSTGRLVVCGPETSGWSFSLPDGVEAVGVRLRPGRAASVLGLDTPGALNRRVAVEDVLGGREQRVLLERLHEAPGPRDRLALLHGMVRDRAQGRPVLGAPASRSASTAAVVSRTLTAAPDTTVADLARESALSERQLHRRCVAAFGYGPAVLRRILRLQRFLRMARHPAATTDLSVLAAMAGYTDQSHLNRDSRALAGVPPSALLGMHLTDGVGDMPDAG
ncbi:helix-turn-helix domain-containing protein [Nocardiopsis suaedae]|uniref:Helix-turn-helix domain-containing protein n=1 Tax=Nocardiopsis suaedae TaxID=3018444 RepID=A0ABT4TVH3_9ACTN|nr:helix-turn-helix domain-containing protein [Nocardiopsis suaedae]MDA2808703.1 helix-turn-helix domain-containing protein [Nocardiopsis suaedae]